MKKFLTTTLLFVFSFTLAYSNNLTQNIKGQILDKASQQPLPGANILIPDSEPAMGAVSDVNGFFKITGVPVGRTSVTISFLGYNTVSLNNLNLASGKELVLNIELEEKVTEYEEVVVKATKPKARPNNDMAVVSARSFTIEETEKYAGSRGDIARMASNYAGVSFANDSRNDIVIRGNTPSGLLWKLEDVEIPNPNHFAENGTSGGPVGMLNNNALKNSDFFTGAFPAEYGNAMSGVFDLKMRNGNTDKYEFTAQCGFNGFEAGAEGPINRKNNSSFLAFYRYSTLDLVDKMGVNMGTTGIPEYQDFTFKVNYPTKKGVFSAFCIAGMSSISMLDSKRDTNEIDMYSQSGQDLINRSTMGTTGITYTHFINSSTYLKTQVSALYQNGGTDIDTITWSPDHTKVLTSTEYLKHDISESRASVSVSSGTKFNSKLNTKTGITVDQMGFDLNSKILTTINNTNSMYPYLASSKSLTDGPQLIRSYYELSYKISETFTINPGAQFMYFTLNDRYAFEPRVGASWAYARNLKLNAGYGLHSRTHPLSTYYYIDSKTTTGELTNKNIDFTKAHHFVLSNDWNMDNDLRLKVETYYQDLFNVPVEKNSSSFSILNSGSTWGIQAPDSLKNTGTGYNYGCEFTFEKFLSKNYYFLLTTSLFESKYKGSDNVLRNTAFNGNYVVNALVGYEYPINEKWALAFDVKGVFAGGKRLTEVDQVNSDKYQEVRYFEDKAYEKQAPMFFKLDVKLGIRENLRGYSMEWQIYVENVTNHDNLLYESYDLKSKKIEHIYQLGFFPMMNWRLNF